MARTARWRTRRGLGRGVRGRAVVVAVVAAAVLAGPVSAGAAPASDPVPPGAGVEGTEAPPLTPPAREATGARAPGVLWNGDFSTRDTSQYSIQACQKDRVTVVPDPLGVRRLVGRFEVRDSDVAPCTPTENPRAQAVSPAVMREGGEYWIGWSTLFPSDFPRWPRGDGWFTFESTYGPPYSGTGPRHMNLLGDPERIGWQRNSSYGYDIPWSIPMVRGRWVDFVVHQKQSRGAQDGYAEIWVNTGSGWVPQRFTNGQTRLTMRTIDESNAGGPNTHDVRAYYKRGMYPRVVVYHGDHRIGTSFAAVAPHSYG